MTLKVISSQKMSKHLLVLTLTFKYLLVFLISYDNLIEYFGVLGLWVRQNKPFEDITSGFDNL